MSWLEKSIMHTRGIPKGTVGRTHELTEKLQGKFHRADATYHYGCSREIASLDRR